MQHTTTDNFDYVAYFDKGIEYAQYIHEMGQTVEMAINGPYAQYIPLNYQRIKRLDKTVILTEESRKVLAHLSAPSRWLVITEHWCGDAAQILPVLHAFEAASGGNIAIRLVYRDQNLELMDRHLTGTSRSIPKLILIDDKGNITATWGPRPAAAQQLVLQLKSDPTTAASYAEQLHKWYADNKTTDIQKEVCQLLAATAQ